VRKNKQDARMDSLTVIDEFHAEWILVVIDNPIPGIVDCVLGSGFIALDNLRIRTRGG